MASSKIYQKAVFLGGAEVGDVTSTGYSLPSSASGASASYKVLMATGANAVTFQQLALTNLSDATISAPASKQVIQYNGSAWVNVQHKLSDDSDVTVSTPAAKNVLYHDGSGWVNQQLTLNDLSAVNTSSLAAKNVLYYSGSEWVNQQIALNDINTVSVSSPTNLQLLRYNGSSWVNADETLNDLSDVTITTPATSQSIFYNGSAWVNRQPTLQDLSDVDAPSPSNGQVLAFSTGTSKWAPYTIPSDVEQKSKGNFTTTLDTNTTDVVQVTVDHTVSGSGYFILYVTVFNSDDSTSFLLRRGVYTVDGSEALTYTSITDDVSSDSATFPALSVDSSSNHKLIQTIQDSASVTRKVTWYCEVVGHYGTTVTFA